MKQERILVSQDGPHSNVIKFKPPMCFSRQDVDLVVDKLDAIFTQVEAGTADLSNLTRPSNCMGLPIPANGAPAAAAAGEPLASKRAKLVAGGGIDTSGVSLEAEADVKADRNGHGRAAAANGEPSSKRAKVVAGGGIDTSRDLMMSKGSK